MSYSDQNLLVIRNIDLPLYEYGLIHRQYINSSFDSKKQRRIQKIKSYALNIWFLFNIIRWFSYAKAFKKGRFLLLEFDFIRYIGGLLEFHYAITILGSILCLRIVYLFNYSDRNHYKWLDIIDLLKRLESKDTIGLFDQNDMRKFIKKIKFFKNVIDLLNYFGQLSFPLMTISVLIVHFDSITVHISYAILNSIMFCLWCYSILKIISYSFFYYFIVCYYCRMRLRSLNKLISKIKIFSKSSKIDEVIKEQNDICNDMVIYNKFWKNYYFAINYVLTPINLMLLEEMLFEKLPFTTLLIVILFLVNNLLSHLMLNILTASLNREARELHKNLLRKSNIKSFTLTIKRKLKVSLFLSFS